MTRWIASNKPGSSDIVHAGVEHARYTDVTRRKVGSHLLTRCNARQLGGPWGYLSFGEGAASEYGDLCAHCVRLVAADRVKFQRKARAWLARRVQGG